MSGAQMWVLKNEVLEKSNTRFPAPPIKNDLRSKKMRCFCVGFFHLKTDHPFRHAKKHLPTLRNGLTNLFPSGKPYIEQSVPGTVTLIGNLSGYQLWNPAPTTVEKATLGFR